MQGSSSVPQEVNLKQIARNVMERDMKRKLMGVCSL